MAYKKTAHRRHRVRSSRRENVKSRKVMRGGRNGKIDDYNGGEYIGHIWNNKPHGNGTWEDDTGVYYHGEWLLGKKNGYGQMEYPNKTIYKGRWKNNKRHGLGSMYYNSGKVATGRWRNDEPIGEFTMKWPKKDNILPDYIIVDASDLDGFEFDDEASEYGTEFDV